MLVQGLCGGWGDAGFSQGLVFSAYTYEPSPALTFRSYPPAGQFGTRLQGGKDAASARYIFTRLEQITRKMFHEADDALLAYLNEEGQSIEPEW